MTSKLPGVNYRAPLGTDDLEFEQNSLGQEIQNRTRLFMNSHFGVVDTLNPRDISVSDLSRPLNVLPSTDPLRVDISPGRAFTRGGNFVELQEKDFLFELASVAVGTVNIVYIEYLLEEGSDRRINKFHVDVAVRNQRPADNSSVLGVATLTNFQNPALFPPSRLDDLVPLAAVTVVQQPDLTTVLNIDLSASIFNFVRPWFSPVDIEHRQSIGTGVVSEANPHGTGLNDLSAGALTLYKQQLRHGMVLSKDHTSAGYPGLKATESIQSSSFSTDATGEVTKGSLLFGGVGAKYANLQHYPVRLGTVYQTGAPAIQLAADIIDGDRIIVIPLNEPLPVTSVVVEYFWSSAGEPPVNPATNNLVFRQPEDSELLISNGIAVSDIPEPVISFDGSGPIPRNYRVFVDEEGVLISSPQVLFGPVKLDALTGPQDLPIAMAGAAQVEIGLTRASNVVGMFVSLRLSGIGTNGAALSEDVAFQFGVYLDTPIPAASENRRQLVRTNSTFASLETVEVLSRADDGNDSTIIVYAAHEPFVTEGITDICPLADVFWDGLAVERVKDARPVNLELKLPSLPVFNNGGVPLDSNTRAWVFENLSEPRFRDSFLGKGAAVSATGTIAIPNNASFRDGDLINLGGGKVLKAKVPTKSTGQISALPLGVEVLVGQATFTVDESGTPVNVNIAPGTFTLDDICVNLAAQLNGSPSLALTYTCVALSSRQITITATGIFALPVSNLGAILGFSSPGSGQTGYTSNAVVGIADGDQFEISDGVTAVTFEFDTGGGASPGVVSVSIAPNALAPAIRTAMINAINGHAFTIVAMAFIGDNTTITLENSTPGDEGNVLIEQSISTGFSLGPVGMSGGSDGGADPTIGEFNVGVGGDSSTTRTNMVSTLNNSSFNSGVTTTLETIGGSPGVRLTKTTAGLNNNEILLTLTIPSPPAVVVTGFAGGTDTYVGVRADRFADGLRSPIPVTDLDLTPEKYRSRAIGAALAFTPVTKVLLVLHNPKNITSNSVRIRAANDDTRGNWQQYAFMTLSRIDPGLAVFTYTFPEPIHKVQLEIFGSFTAYSLMRQVP